MLIINNDEDPHVLSVGDVQVHGAAEVVEGEVHDYRDVEVHDEEVEEGVLDEEAEGGHDDEEEEGDEVVADEEGV